MSTFADTKSEVIRSWGDVAGVDLADLLEVRGPDQSSLWRLRSGGLGVHLPTLRDDAPPFVQVRVAWYAFSALTGACPGCGRVAEVMPTPPQVMIRHERKCVVPDIPVQWAVDRDVYARLSPSVHQLGALYR